jgi:hypothetical protein
MRKKKVLENGQMQSNELDRDWRLVGVTVSQKAQAPSQLLTGRQQPTTSNQKPEKLARPALLSPVVLFSFGQFQHRLTAQSRNLATWQSWQSEPWNPPPAAVTFQFPHKESIDDNHRDVGSVSSLCRFVCVVVVVVVVVDAIVVSLFDRDISKLLIPCFRSPRTRYYSSNSFLSPF